MFVTALDKRKHKGDYISSPIDAYRIINGSNHMGILRKENIATIENYGVVIRDGLETPVVVMDDIIPIPQSYALSETVINAFKNIDQYEGNKVERLPLEFSRHIALLVDPDAIASNGALKIFQSGFMDSDFIEDYLELRNTCRLKDLKLSEFSIDDFSINKRGNIVFSAFDKILVNHKDVIFEPHTLTKDITGYVSKIHDKYIDTSLSTSISLSMGEINSKDKELYLDILHNIKDSAGSHDNYIVANIPGDDKHELIISDYHSKPYGKESDKMYCSNYVYEYMGACRSDDIVKTIESGRIGNACVNVIEKTSPLDLGIIDKYSLDAPMLKVMGEMNRFVNGTHHLSQDFDLDTEDGKNNIVKRCRRMFIFKSSENGINPYYINSLPDLNEKAFERIYDIVKNMNSLGMNCEQVVLSDFSKNANGGIVLTYAENVELKPDMHDSFSYDDITDRVKNLYQPNLENYRAPVHGI